MARYRVAIYGKTYEAMVDLVRVHRVEVLDHGARKVGEGRFRAYALLDAEGIKRVEAAGFAVERHEDVDAVTKERQREVGLGERYERRSQR